MPQLGKFLQHLENEGLHIVYVDPKKFLKSKQSFQPFIHQLKQNT